MDDKTKGVGGERTSGRSDEYISGREALDTDGRIGERGTSRIPSRPAGAAGPIGTVAASSDTTRNYVPASGSREAEPEQRTREIRAEIEQTREEMTDTVNAIQDRLRPATLAANAAETVKNTVKNAASETAREVADKARDVADKARDMADSEPVQYVRANPIPTAMVGIGIVGVTWLALAGRQSRSNTIRNSRDWRRVAPYDEGDRYYRAPATSRGAYTGQSDSSGNTGYYGEAGYTGEVGYSGEAAYETAAACNPDLSYGSRSDYVARDRSSGESSSRGRDGAVSRGAQDLSRRLERTTREAQQKVQRTWQENPLLMGAASALLGLMVGMAAPQTETENELMGEARDNAVEGVQQTVRETVNKVQEVAATALGGDQQGQQSTDRGQQSSNQGQQSGNPGQQSGSGL